MTSYELEIDDVVLGVYDYCGEIVIEMQDHRHDGFPEIVINTNDARDLRDAINTAITEAEQQ